jgi:outer membrane cobalamin receptor
VFPQFYKIPTILFLIIPILLAAQENQISYEIDTIFVTASRVEEPISRIPLSVNLITEEEIKLRNYGDISSILNNLPGIDIRAYSIIGGATSISLFGSTSQQVLVLVDGRTINSPNLGVADLGLISTDNLKKIEIVNGPISSLYGANALGGVVNIVTKNPGDFPKPGVYYDASLQYGSYHTNCIYLGTGISNNKLGLLFDANYKNSRGIRNNDDCLKQGIGLKLSYQNINQRLRVDLDYETKENGLPGPKPSPSKIPIYGDSTATSIYDRTADTAFSVRGEWDYDLTPKFSLKLIPIFSKNWTRFLWVDAYSVDTTLYQDRYATQNIGVSLITNCQSSNGIRVNGGLDLKQDDFQANSFLYDELVGNYQDTIWQAKAQRIGVFGEANINIGKYVILIPVGRLDWNSDFGNFFSPSLGFLFPMSSAIRLRIHFGRAFRAPTFNDLYWPKSGNQEIKPEFGDALQSGMDWKGNEGQSFSFTGFVRKTKDLIAWVPDTAGIWHPINIDESEIFGISNKGEIRLLKRLIFGYSLNLFKANQIRKELVYSDWTTGTTRFELKKRRAAFLPEFTLSQEISYKGDFGTNFALEFVETGKRVNYYPVYDSLPIVYLTKKTLPFNFIVNLRMHQRLLSRIEFILRIENLFNQNYAEQFGNSLADLDYPRPKFTIFSEVRFANF